MSATRDKFKCYALDLSLLAVTEKRPLRLQRPKMAHPNGFVVSRANVIAIVTRSVNRVTEMVKGRMGQMIKPLSR